jgi:hypothetical protein
MNPLSADANSPSPPRTKYLKYVGLAMAIAVCATLAVVVHRVVVARRVAVDAMHEDECSANLKRIGVALQQYHDRCGSFPPAYVLNEQGQRWHSWRVLLLPDLGYADLYDQYRFDELWNGPHNRQLLARMPAVYGCPADQQRAAENTNYFAIVGPQTAWPEYCALSIGHVTDGTANTVSLIESVDAGIAWLEPRDMNYADLKNGAYHSNPRPSLPHTEMMHLLFLDGSLRKCNRNLDEKDFRAICTPAEGQLFPGVEWQLPASEVAEFQTGPRPASELPKTAVTPHLNFPLVSGRNAVYCANFQLAWDRLREDIIRAPVALEGSPDMADELNQRAFLRDSLAEDAYVAMAGRLSDGILDDIKAQMAAKFPTFTSRLVPAAEKARTEGLVAYAYLQKRLPFAVDFDRMKQPLQFHAADGETDVASFGIEDFRSHEPREKGLREQVTVLDYVGPDNFVLQLMPQKDTIVLGKIPRAATLAEALAAVQARIAQPLGRDVQKELEVEETLVVPLLSLFIERKYSELIGRTLLNPGFTTQFIGDATQVIRFQLDESGAILEAEAGVMMLNGDVPPPKPRRFVFDRSFLIYLQQRRAKQPYFVMWVENPEVLVPNSVHSTNAASAKNGEANSNSTSRHP